MLFHETKLAGAFIIEQQKHEDARGYFARTFCHREFEARGLNPNIRQASLAYNRRKGTLRGMHFQYPPAAESKLVRATRGAILDKIVDLRPESETFLQHVSVELSSSNGLALYVPERFAHGYQVLEDDTEASYDIGEYYAPDLAWGLSPFDTALDLTWPLPVTEISDKDRNWQAFSAIRDSLITRMRTGGGHDRPRNGA
jgi:dTDP-4-dehydrorhamnose 3,5-epimerase